LGPTKGERTAEMCVIRQNSWKTKVLPPSSTHPSQSTESFSRGLHLGAGRSERKKEVGREGVGSDDEL